MTGLAKYIPCEACNDAPRESAKECAGFASQDKVEGFHLVRFVRGRQLEEDVRWLLERAGEWSSVPPVAMALRQAADDMHHPRAEPHALEHGRSRLDGGKSALPRLLGLGAGERPPGHGL